MPQWLSQYDSALQLAFANALFALSTWVSMSVGLLSFASVAFGAAGAFTSARLDISAGMPFAELVVVGAIVGAFLALISVTLLGRLEGHWFALATVALLLITRVVVLNATGITGGSIGMPVQKKTGWLSLVLVVALIYWIVWRLRRSRLGLAADAVRTDPSVASCMGIDIRRLQVSMFVLSGAIGGVGGVVLAQLLQYISPDTFYITVAFAMIAAVVLGGSYHWAGSLVGAFIFTLLPQVLEGFMSNAADVLNGVLLIIIMVYLPRGILDPRRSLRRRWTAQKRGTPLGGGVSNVG